MTEAKEVKTLGEEANPWVGEGDDKRLDGLKSREFRALAYGLRTAPQLAPQLDELESSWDL